MSAIPSVPARASDDPAVLMAWYYGEGMFSHFRKVALAAVAETLRAQFADRGDKITESRLDQLAHQHPLYIAFLVNHLEGRTKWSEYYLEQGGLIRG